MKAFRPTPPAQMQHTLRILAIPAVLAACVVAAFVHVPASRAAAADCASIADASERLACFDEAFPAAPVDPADDTSSTDVVGPVPAPVTPAYPAAGHGAETGTPASVPVASPPAQPAKAKMQANATAKPAPAAADPAPAAAEASPPAREKKGWFSFNRDHEVITARIVDILNKDQQRVAFRLDNDEIWVQSSPRNLPFKIGDRITIKSATVGGYILRNEAGTSTRVARADSDS